jgi:hypothetical protein
VGLYWRLGAFRNGFNLLLIAEVVQDAGAIDDLTVWVGGLVWCGDRCPGLERSSHYTSVSFLTTTHDLNSLKLLSYGHRFCFAP